MVVLFFMTSLVTSAIAIDVSCPHLCDCSQKDLIVCTDPSITNISALLIPNRFTYITISGTQAPELTSTSFQHMPVTLRLFLEGNQFSLVTSEVFKNFPLLKSLKLSNNYVRDLPPEVFHTLFHLEQLFLNQNKLSRLDPHIFKDLRNLTHLMLNRNMLKELPAGLLDNLVNLKEINLSRNKLSSLPKHIFSSLSKLVTLLLYDNQLEELTPGMFDNLTELTDLSLHTNLIETIDKKVFYNLPSLQKLALYKNRLKTLPGGLFLYLPRLERLMLYENPLTELPTVLFGKMDYLKSFWLYRTNLPTIPSFVFSNLTNLNLLIVTMNPMLHSLPAETFRGLRKLSELSLHTNSLRFLEDGLFQDLQQLQALSLYNNNFEDLPETLFHPLINLQNVNVNNSKLKTLPGNFFEGLTRLQDVHLDGNLWVCDCRIKGFKVWLEKNPGIVQNAISLICDSPLELKGRSILEVNAPDCIYTTTQSESSSYKATSLLMNTKGPQYIREMTLTATTQGFHNATSTPFNDHSTDSLPSTTTSPSWPTTHTPKPSNLSTLADPTTGWLKNDSSSPSSPSLWTIPVKTIFSKEDLHNDFFEKLFGFRLPYGTIICYLVVITATSQCFILLVTCFSLLKIRQLYRYFYSNKEPVVLQRILIPLSPTSTYK